MKLELYCTCGASWTGDVPAPTADIVREMFQEYHHGPGHESCDRKTAQRAQQSEEVPDADA